MNYQWFLKGSEGSFKHGQDSIFLVGNKTDLEDMRRVFYEEGQRYADNNGMVFFETSSKNGSNVNALFQNIAAKIALKRKEEKKVDKVEIA